MLQYDQIGKDAKASRNSPAKLNFFANKEEEDGCFWITWAKFVKNLLFVCTLTCPQHGSIDQ